MFLTVEAILGKSKRAKRQTLFCVACLTELKPLPPSSLSDPRQWQVRTPVVELCTSRQPRVTISHH